MQKRSSDSSRRLALQTLGACIATAFPILAIGQPAWPTKPIRLVLPSGAGGGSDIFGRPLAQWLSQELGQPVLVDNKPGANGAVAHEQVVRLPGDGYNLVISFAAAILGNKAMNAKLQHDTIADLKPIANIAEGGNLLVVNTEFPVNDIKQLIAYAKSQPGGINYGSWGVGSGGHLIMETLKERTGMTLNHIPYKTGAAIAPDVVSGVLKVSTIDSATPVALIKSGRIRAIAALSPKRLPQLPDVPTLDEQGYPLGFAPWFGMFGPASMPPELVNRINTLINRWLVTPEAVAVFEQRQNSPAPTPKSAEAFAAQIQAELPVWRKMMQAAKIEGA